MCSSQARVRVLPRLTRQVRNGLMYHVFASHDRRRVEVFGFAIR